MIRLSFSGFLYLTRGVSQRFQLSTLAVGAVISNLREPSFGILGNNDFIEQVPSSNPSGCQSL
jgi:hypothetical protein